MYPRFPVLRIFDWLLIYTKVCVPLCGITGLPEPTVHIKQEIRDSTNALPLDHTTPDDGPIDHQDASLPKRELDVDHPALPSVDCDEGYNHQAARDASASSSPEHTEVKSGSTPLAATTGIRISRDLYAVPVASTAQQVSEAVMSASQTVSSASMSVVTTNHTVSPATQTVMPAYQIVQPANQTVMPTSQSVRPASQTERTTSQTVRPADQTVRPAGQTVRPANLTPAHLTLMPANETVRPASLTGMPASHTVVAANTSSSRSAPSGSVIRKDPLLRGCRSNQPVSSNVDIIEVEDSDEEEERVETTQLISSIGLITEQETRCRPIVLKSCGSEMIFSGSRISAFLSSISDPDPYLDFGNDIRFFP
jgi:hypothetical protein